MQKAENTTWLKELRREADLTQEGLAFRLGVCVSTIRSWERGKAQPAMTLEQWQKLAAVAKVPLNELEDKISSVV